MSNLADLPPDARASVDAAIRAASAASAASAVRLLLIRGVTSNGRPFRPGDWSERLAGALAFSTQQMERAPRGIRIGYSRFARPTIVDGVKCVVLDERLRDVEPRAFDFALNFARDNDLPVEEIAALPGIPPGRG